MDGTTSPNMSQKEILPLSEMSVEHRTNPAKKGLLTLGPVGIVVCVLLAISLAAIVGVVVYYSASKANFTCQCGPDGDSSRVVCVDGRCSQVQTPQACEYQRSHDFSPPFLSPSLCVPLMSVSSPSLPAFHRCVP